MAIIFVPLNGIGLGHVTRAYIIASALREQGLQPLIFAQGCYPKHMGSEVPGLSIGTIYNMSLEERVRVSRDLERMVKLGLPQIMIDDTHPTPLSFKEEVQRILLVRPTEMSYMRHLRRHYSTTYCRTLVVDEPCSPTWPFGSNETAEIQSWPDWLLVGPIYRAARTYAEEIAQKYNVQPDRPVYVFSMGGGGVQNTGEDEVARFCSESAAIGALVRARHSAARLLFVRGPLFPASAMIPQGFEDVSAEPDMPALLAVSAGAIIRPGYNSTWECLSAGVPLFPIVGTTFMEPVGQRVRRLADLGLATTDPYTWMDPAWIDQFKLKVRAVIERWPPQAGVNKVITVVRNYCSLVSTRITPIQKSQRLRPSPLPESFRFCVRVDDVASLDEDVISTIDMCVKLNLKISLEVVPYLCTLDESVLRSYWPEPVHLEVSQHGFAHIPRRQIAARKAEFVDQEHARQDLRMGRSTMERLFPRTFRQGFSAPYDFAASFVPDTWRALGGRYLSVCKQELPNCTLPIVSLSLDPWNWLANRPVSGRLLLRAIPHDVRRRGYVGVVLHPHLMRDRAELKRVAEFLKAIVERGGKPVFISELVKDRRTPYSRICSFVDSLREREGTSISI
jgi:hypothetical protein